jgi:hypothetical protein
MAGMGPGFPRRELSPQPLSLCARCGERGFCGGMARKTGNGGGRGDRRHLPLSVRPEKTVGVRAHAGAIAVPARVWLGEEGACDPGLRRLTRGARGADARASRRGAGGSCRAGGRVRRRGAGAADRRSSSRSRAAGAGVARVAAAAGACGAAGAALTGAEGPARVAGGAGAAILARARRALAASPAATPAPAGRGSIVRRGNRHHHEGRHPGEQRTPVIRQRAAGVHWGGGGLVAHGDHLVPAGAAGGEASRRG